jgi:predicted nucleic acid-binding protein
MRNGDSDRVGDFDMFFSTRVDEMVDFTAAVFRRAAKIRASGGFKTPDALHLAAAIQGGCTAFLTNDSELIGFAGLAVELV